VANLNALDILPKMTDEVMTKIEEIVGNKPDARVSLPLNPADFDRSHGQEIFSFRSFIKVQLTFSFILSSRPQSMNNPPLT
jgi:hypothetical protein